MVLPSPVGLKMRFQKPGKLRRKKGFGGPGNSGGCQNGISEVPVPIPVEISTPAAHAAHPIIII